MILRCRRCGKDNTVDINVEAYSCSWCGARFELKVSRIVTIETDKTTEIETRLDARGAKFVDREPVKPTDPLGDFR